MVAPSATPPSATGSRVSRAPVVVTIVGLGIALAAVVIAARGSPAPEVHVDRAGTAADPREISVILKDYRFLPGSLQLVPGETVRFRILNGGLVTHELVLGDQSVQEAWAGAEAVATPPNAFATPPPASVAGEAAGLRVILASGGSDTVVYTVPRSGELELACHIPGHVERGMVAQVRLVTPVPGGG